MIRHAIAEWLADLAEPPLAVLVVAGFAVSTLVMILLFGRRSK